MDESHKSDDAAPAKYPWLKDEGPAEDLAATAVFGTVPETGTDATSVAQSLVRPTQPGPLSGREVLQQPVVHKVVLGGGPATAPVDLLGLLRSGSPAGDLELTPSLAVPPHGPVTAAFAPVAGTAPTPGQQPAPQSEGFTQLIRALSGESSPASAPAQPSPTQPPVVSPNMRATGMESGFTSLLRTLNPDEEKDRAQRPPDPPIPARSSPPSEGAGGFTALLQGFSVTGLNPSEGIADPKPFHDNPDPTLPGSPTTTGPFAPPSAPVQSSPGTFTRYFKTLDPNMAGPAACPAPAGPSGSPPGEEPSFTQLISTIGQRSPAASPSRESSQSALDDLPRGTTPVREDPLGLPQFQTGTAGWPPVTAPRPQVNSASGAGGLTEILRTLEEPSKGSEIPNPSPMAETPVPSAAGSLFTQTYKKLDEPAEPPSPAPLPSQLPSRLSATQVYQPPLAGGVFPGTAPSSPAAPIPGGHSDVTRIIDASRLREMQRQGVSAPAPAIGPAASAQPLPSQPGVPMPPAAPNLQWQPQVPPAPVPGQPLQFNPAIQAPQYTPPAPAPQMPAPAPTAQPAVGKMQQYLPLLLIIIIFLLVVILVTMVFLLKH